MNKDSLKGLQPIDCLAFAAMLAQLSCLEW
jgi:hypothetical protein